jgi:hypothetical protein
VAQLSTNFNVGDTAYYCIFATACIYKVQVTDVYAQNGVIWYTLFRPDLGVYIKRVSQDSVQTFTDAKATLLTYLQNKITEITNLTA